MSVNAPWTSLRLQGRHLPLIIDEQGDFHDEAALRQLAAGRTAAGVPRWIE